MELDEDIRPVESPYPQTVPVAAADRPASQDPPPDVDTELPTNDQQASVDHDAMEIDAVNGTEGEVTVDVSPSGAHRQLRQLPTGFRSPQNSSSNLFGRSPTSVTSATSATHGVVNTVRGTVARRAVHGAAGARDTESAASDDDIQLVESLPVRREGSLEAPTATSDHVAELYLLVAKFLEDGPCKEAAQVRSTPSPSLMVLCRCFIRKWSNMRYCWVLARLSLIYW